MSIYTRICRKYYVFRHSSTPFISGDGFRSFIKNRVEGRHPNFNHSNAPIVFCESDYVETFLRQRKKSGGKPFVLVSGNGDCNYFEDTRHFFPENMVHWFGQNILFKDQRVSPIPIGLENRFYGNSGSLSLLFKTKQSVSQKTTRIFYSFTVSTNKTERIRALEAAKIHALGVGSKNPIPVSEFQAMMAACKFTLSPPGNGFDCHRTWEALYLETIPIVKKSYWSEYFISLGIPLLSVDRWEEILGFDEIFLNSYYKRNQLKFKSPALYLDFWKTKIVDELDSLHQT